MDAITETNLDLELLKKGKVRDTYTLDDTLLMVATDRLSAFDVVFNEGIPYKGKVLTQISKFWFNKTKHITDNHLISTDVPEVLPAYLNKRTMIVKKCKTIPIECVVRGYLTGSGWKSYQKTKSVCGIELPDGLKNGSELPEPIFTPSTKAETGHDENITEERAKEIVGDMTFEIIKQTSLALYEFAKRHALNSGLVLADTKFEFGHLEEDGNKRIILIDEALTPDSSRYWVKEKYDQGVLESMDKQFTRDYLEGLNWDKNPPPPTLPPEIVQKTSERYLEAYRMLTGKELD